MAQQTDLPTAVFENFQRQPLSSEPLKEGIVPGAGKATCDKLETLEITTAVALMGYYLLLNRDKDLFIKFLVASDVQKRYAEKIAEALSVKSMDFCTTIAHNTSPAKKADGTTTTVAENFDRSPLSTCKLTAGVVPGIGDKSIPKVLRRLKAKLGDMCPPGSPTAVQLLGLYLAYGRSKTPFIEWLTGECDCQKQHAEKTCEALENKAKGICDSSHDPHFSSPSRSHAPGLPSTPEEGGGKIRSDELKEMQERSASLQRTLLGVLLVLAAGAVVVHLVWGFNFDF